ncbi:MAG: hypothetical protein ACI39R_04930 [Lachnospiraceae bacterium]
MKEKIVNTIIVIFILATLSSFAFADDNLNSSLHRHYISKTYASAPASATHTAKNEVIDGISIFITKINDGDDKTSDYNYIRMYLHGGNDTTNWIGNSSAFVSGYGQRTCTLKLAKRTYYEFFTGSIANNGLVMTYYGNSSSLDAYAYIREGLNEDVSTSY